MKLRWEKRTFQSKNSPAFTLVETELALAVAGLGILLLAGVIWFCHLTVADEHAVERFQYAKFLSEIYSDQLDLRGQFYHIEANKQDYIAYYSSKTKKKYALEYYWKRDALVMVSCSSEAGKMPLLYKVTQMKQTINHGYQRIKLEMDDGQIFEEEIVVPTKKVGNRLG